MIQKKILCKDYTEAQDAVKQFADIISGTAHKSALITFYEKGFTRAEAESLISLMKSFGFPELKIAGISITLVAELIPNPSGILFNLILTEEADIDVIAIPCLPGRETEAARVLKARLDGTDNVKAVELFGSNIDINTNLFIRKSMEGHEDAPLFGTATIKNVFKRISIAKGIEQLEVAGVAPDAATDEFICTDEIFSDGFVAIVFSGEKLNVKANYALGWKPIGRRFTPEFETTSAKGVTVITKLNSMPAVDIYKEYLGVYPDEYLISNICEFPFIIERDGLNVCMIPLEQGKDGELLFMYDLNEDEKMRFSFASHDEVLQASLESLSDMEAFDPEAVFLTLCGNRINFLKEDAHLEWDGFSNNFPDLALMHGAGEIYYHHGKGGVLNSAHLAIGFREKASPERKDFIHPSVESLRHGHVLSLSDRMSVFLSKITTELIDVARQARDASNAKSAFLSHMSHEIRTPINAIIGIDEMILRESSEENILDYADSIKSAGNNLLGIVNDILDLSKIEAGKMSIVPDKYELISVIKDMVNVVKLRAESKGLEVILDIDPNLPSVLYGDATRIKQIISNILTNAVKYTEEGSVTFRINKIADEPDKSVRIGVFVKDTGIGIRPEDKEKLFDEYERFDEKRNHSVEGTGLGLSITKQLLELMGSRLNVESVYGEGSEFGFEIIQGVVDDTPIGDISNKLKRKSIKKGNIIFTAEDARILVVDDNKMNLNVVQKLLKKTKITVDTAMSGAEAIELVQKYAYDIIFMDHLMPEMDGPETLMRMNELDNNLSYGASMISLTANAMTDSGEVYRKLGFRDYISKPIHPEELDDMLYKYLPAYKIRTVHV